MPGLEKPRWDITKAAMTRRFYLVTRYPEGHPILASNVNGQTFDEVYQEAD